MHLIHLTHLLLNLLKLLIYGADRKHFIKGIAMTNLIWSSGPHDYCQTPDQVQQSSPNQSDKEFTLFFFAFHPILSNIKVKFPLQLIVLVAIIILIKPQDISLFAKLSPSQPANPQLGAEIALLSL